MRELLIRELVLRSLAAHRQFRITEELHSHIVRNYLYISVTLYMSSFYTVVVLTAGIGITLEKENFLL